MSNGRFPRWAGPFVGAAVGALIGWRMLRLYPNNEGWERWQVILFAAAIGLFAGIIVALLDRPASSRSAEPLYEEETGRRRRARRPEAGVAGRLLALLSVLFWCLPILGLGLGIVAVLVNFRTPGWERITSYIGAALGALVTTALLVVQLVYGK
jgi:ABC-type Fe3+ transport system permease subunit